LRAALVYDQERLKQLPDGVFLLVAVADAGMFDAAICESQKIIVIRDDDASFSQSVRDVIFVSGPQQTRLYRGGHVHAVASESNGDRGPNTFVKMIPNHRGRPFAVQT
jgi:hypothetical protein